jgi:DNA-binding LytR/AlgR family response regulator
MDVEKLSVFSDSIFIKSNNRYIKTNIKEIIYLQSQDKYVELITIDQKRFVVRSSLESFLLKFAPFNFIRVHKSYAINPVYLEEINGSVIVVNKTEIPIGRSYRDGLIRHIDTFH